MTEANALYAYAILPADAALPHTPCAILPGASLALHHGGGCVALVSAVSRSAFVERPAAEPDQARWIAARTQAHHATIAAAASAGPVLPLAFGSVFEGAGALSAWLDARAPRLRAALSAVAGCAEFTLRLEEDTEGHIAWLDGHDAELRALAEDARQAAGDDAFRLGGRRARRITEAREARQQELCRELSAQLQRHARLLPGEMTALVRDADVPALRADLERMARDLSGTGLALRLAGPWPPYASARAALREG